jgi:hypothetical protein
MNLPLGPLTVFYALSLVFSQPATQTQKSPADNNDKACQLPLQDFHKRKISFPECGYEGEVVFSDIVFYKEQPFKR